MKGTRLIFSIVCLFITVNALYEDQIGKFDWRQQWVGKAEHVVWEKVPRSHPRRVIIGSSENVVAALSPKSGSLLWRQVLEKGDSGTIRALSVGKEVVSVSGSSPGLHVRGWDISRGHLLWNSFIQLNTEKAGNFFVHVGQDELHIIRAHPSSHILITGYNLKNGEEVSTRTIPAPWYQSIETSCLLTNNYFACVDPETSSLFSMDVLDGGSFVSKHLSLLGMDSATHSAELKPCSTCTTLDTVVIDLGNRRQTLVKLSEDPEMIGESGTADKIGVLEVDGKTYMYSLYRRELRFKDLSTGSELEELTSVLEIPILYGDIQLLSPCLFPKKDHVLTYRALTVTSDHAILVFQPQGKMAWYREEALASIEVVEMVDLPISSSEAAFEDEFRRTDNVISKLLHRISSQLIQVQKLLLKILGVGVPGEGVASATLTRDEFNLHKMIVVVTSAGKLYGLDNLSGDIIWSRLVPSIAPSLQEKKLLLYIQRGSSFMTFSAQAVLLGSHRESGEGVLFVFNPLTGEGIGAEGGMVRFRKPIKQALLLHQMTEDFLHPLVLVDSSMEVNVYPSYGARVIYNNRNNLFFYSADSNSGDITGYDFRSCTPQNLILNEIWKVSMPGESQNIVKVVHKRLWERVHSQGRVLGDRSVLFKYINPNLVAVVTQGFKQSVKSINIYLLDTVTGHIVHALSHSRARGPILAVHAENWMVYSYYNEKFRRTEVASLELYEGKVQSNTTAFSSLSPPANVMVEQQAYILPAGGLDALRDTVTDKGITSKHLLFALPSGGIVELPWMFLNPRRPLVLTPEEREEGLIPYMPELPLPDEQTINYNQSLNRVKDIYTTHSGLESTCLVFVYGLDVFYTRVTPSKTFDVLKDDFDHFFICVVLIGLLIASYVTKQLAARKALNQAWK